MMVAHLTSTCNGYPLKSAKSRQNKEASNLTLEASLYSQSCQLLLMLFRGDDGFCMVLICAKSFVFIVLGANRFFFDGCFFAAGISFVLVFSVVHFESPFPSDSVY
jgi:hypothetical protein